MFDTFEEKETGGGHSKVKNNSFTPADSRLALLASQFSLLESEQRHRRPDAVSTLLLCPDHIELYGVQQLSGAVAPLEKKQKSELWSISNL